MVAAVFAIVPVGVHFGDDPLLRLRQLDPELSPPGTTAVCGSPVVGLGLKATGTTLYEVARAGACRAAARRRLLIAVAAGSAIVMFGLVGMAARESRREAWPVGYPRGEENLGGRQQVTRSG